MVTEPATPSSVVAVTVTLRLCTETAVSVTVAVAGFATTGLVRLLMVIVCGSDEVHVTSRCDETSVPNVSMIVAVAMVLFAPAKVVRIDVPGFGVTVLACPMTVINDDPDALLFVLVAVIVAVPAAEPVALT